MFIRQLQTIQSEIKLSDLANMGQLVDRLASCLPLAQTSFRKERDGYALKAGQLRFYGAYSRVHSGKFVLSHPLVKRHDKLAEADLLKIRNCLKAFDALQQLTANPRYPS